MNQNFLKKIFPILIIFSLITGNLVLAQPISRGRGIPQPEEIAPEFKFIFPKSGDEIRGEIQIKGRIKDANSVEFYYQIPGVFSPIYLGSGQVRGENLWEYSWNTNLTPNSDYQLFAKISNPYGEYFGEKITITIENEIERDEEKEERKREEIEEVKEAIEKEKEKIKEKKEEIEKEVVKKTKEGVEKSKGILEEEQKKEIELEIKEKLDKGKEEIKKGFDEITELTKKEENLEKEIVEKKEKEKDIKKKIEEIKKKIKELEKVEKRAEAAGIIEQKEQSEIIKKSKKIELESLLEEKEKIEKELEKSEKRKEEIQVEKEKKEEKILKKATEPIRTIERIIRPEKKDQILKIEEGIKEEIKTSLSQLEKEISEREEIKAEKKEILLKDSDKDGLSDEFELLVGTDSLNPDSDGDGFLDSNEYELGYDPLKPGPADKIIFSDPRKVKPKKADIYYVERVRTITLPAGQLGIKIEGKGLPNSFATIYIYSRPIVMVTKIDGNGNWSIVLDRPLADGTHEAYIAVTNNRGEITARSEPFVFEKSGERIVAITVAGLLAERVVSPIQLYQFSFLILTISLIILGIGIALFIIGISIQKRLKREGKSNLG